MFLSAAHLQKLTGKKRPSAQARWLSARNWKFDRNAIGEVVVLEREAERQLCSDGARGRKKDHRDEPNLGALQ
jgi:hypothetical protein